MNTPKRPADTFESRVRSAMKTRGIEGVAEFARRLSGRLGRKVERQTVSKWLQGTGVTLRVDVMHAIADELNYSGHWLCYGSGTPQRWVAMDDKTKELSDVFKELTEAAKVELISYAYRLLRISGKQSLVAPYPPAPPPHNQ